MASQVLLISRQDIANRASTKLKLVSAPGFGLDLPTLAWWLDYPQSQMEFSRVGPIELVHGGAWARTRSLESLRWPYLGQCVIHGRAIGLRLGVPGPVPMRGLTDWEATNQQPTQSSKPQARKPANHSAVHSLWMGLCA